MRTIRDVAYFDTSVLLKRYVQESETDRAMVLMKRHRVITSAIAPLEAFSALRRLETTGAVQGKSYRAILKRIQSDRQNWDFVAISLEILRSAEHVVQDLNVRCLDAIHLASAGSFQTRLNRRVSFITADLQQRNAASRLDLEVVWIK